MAIKLATYNIQYGMGMDGSYNIERIAAAVADADIIAIQEVSRNSPWNGGADVEAALRLCFPDRFIACHYPADVDFGSAVKDGKVVENRFQFGNMVVSRFPLQTVRCHLLPRTLRSDQLNLQRGALEAMVATPDGPLRVYNVHLDHIDTQERLAQVAEVKRIAMHFAQTGGAISGLSAFNFPELPLPDNFVILGDCNFEPGSAEMAAMTQGGMIVDVTASDPAHTWFDPRGQAPSQRLDHCFANAVLAARVRSVRVDVDDRGSDHRPVWIYID